MLPNNFSIQDAIFKRISACEIVCANATVYNQLSTNEAQVFQFVNNVPLLRIEPTLDDHIVNKKYVTRLNDAFTGLFDTLSNSIRSEISRAVEAEQNITQSLDNLATDLSEKGLLYQKVSSSIIASVFTRFGDWIENTNVLDNIKKAITDEISRAISSESNIQSQINFYYIMQDITSNFFQIISRPISFQTARININTDGWFFTGTVEIKGGFEISSNFETLFYKDLNNCAVLLCFPEQALESPDMDFSLFKFFLRIETDMIASYRIPQSYLQLIQKNIQIVFFIGSECPSFRAPGGIQPLAIPLELFDTSEEIGPTTLTNTTKIKSIGLNWSSNIIVTQVIIGSKNGTEVYLFSNDTILVAETKLQVTDLYSYFFPDF